MIVELDGLSEREAYRLVTQTVVPRPIAWVLSDSGYERPLDDRWNLAPFSYFAPVCSAPPLIVFSIGNSMAGRVKDTYRNLIAREHFTVSIPAARQATDVQASAETMAWEKSEASHFGIELETWDWPTPRVASAAVALGCRRTEMIKLPNPDQHLVLAQICLLHVIDQAVEQADGGLTARPEAVDISAARLDPLCRLGRGQYGSLGSVFWPESHDAAGRSAH